MDTDNCVVIVGWGDGGIRGLNGSWKQYKKCQTMGTSACHPIPKWSNG